MHVLVVLIISRLQPPEDLHSYNMDSLYTIIVYIYSAICIVTEIKLYSIVQR